MSRAQPYPVVGCKDTGTGIQPRQEVRDLQLNNPIQFSLFIQALSNVMAMKDDDPNSPRYINSPNSWWQMGAIHGLPYQPWSGDTLGPQEPDPNSEWGGYCYHRSALFPPWHRVLLMLVEQSVVDEAIQIATKADAEEPEIEAAKANWVQAAKHLRFPFWDWTKRETATEGIPNLFREPKISIRMPNNKYQSVQNPLYCYNFNSNFKPGTVEGVEYMGEWERTYRWVPFEDGGKPTKEMYDQAHKAFSEGAILQFPGDDPIQLQPLSWLRSKVAGLFTYELTTKPDYGSNMWGYFSNRRAGDQGVHPPMPVMPPSVEEPHDMVHLDIGGNGMMSFNEYAGFDPIFYLHHCNVDRLYAFWEYVYPEYWMGTEGWKDTDGKHKPFITPFGNFYQDTGATVNSVTPLLPFRTSEFEYPPWYSEATRSLLNNAQTQKYYTYPPIKDTLTNAEVKVDVPYDVSDLALRTQYRNILFKEWGQDPQATRQLLRSASKQASMHKQLELLLKESEDGVAQMRNFVIIGELPEFAFPGSYRLELYLLPKEGTDTRQVVNSISVFGRSNPDNCAACRTRRDEGSKLRGHMFLDPLLILWLMGQQHGLVLEPVTELEELHALILGSFGTRIITPDGRVLAVSEPGKSTTWTPLEVAKAPKLSLHSQTLSFATPDVSPMFPHGRAHLTFGNPQSHGHIGASWVTAPSS